MLARMFAGGLLAIVLSGCAGGALLAAPSTGTVSGHVELRVCGGAYQIDQSPCQVRPDPGIILTFVLISNSNGSTGSPPHISTDANGAYTISLPQGTYTVSAASPQTFSTKSLPQTIANNALAPRAFSGPQHVDVVAGRTVTADFAYLIELL
jgi:hypothetical protein